MCISSTFSHPLTFSSLNAVMSMKANDLHKCTFICIFKDFDTVIVDNILIIVVTDLYIFYLFILLNLFAAYLTVGPLRIRWLKLQISTLNKK